MVRSLGVRRWLWVCARRDVSVHPLRAPCGWVLALVCGERRLWAARCVFELRFAALVAAPQGSLNARARARLLVAVYVGDRLWRP